MIKINELDTEVEKVIEYFEGAPIIIRMPEPKTFEASITLYAEEIALTLTRRDSTLSGCLYRLYQSMMEHKQANSNVRLTSNER